MTGFWICLVKVSQGFEYVSGCMQGCEYAEVMKGVEYALIGMKTP